MTFPPSVGRLAPILAFAAAALAAAEERRFPDTPPEIFHDFVTPIRGADIRRLPDSRVVGAPRTYRGKGTPVFPAEHRGLDFFEPIGTPVHATAAGVVLRADTHYVEMAPAERERLLRLCTDVFMGTPSDIFDKLHGRTVLVDHGVRGGFRILTRYAHLDTALVEAGQSVAAGQVIGTVGNSGLAEGARGECGNAHLHFDLMLQHPEYGEWPFGVGLSPRKVRALYAQILKPLSEAESGGEKE